MLSHPIIQSDEKTENTLVNAIHDCALITDEKILHPVLEKAFAQNHNSTDTSRKICLIHAVKSGNPAIVKWLQTKEEKGSQSNSSYTSQQYLDFKDHLEKSAFSYAIEYPDDANEKNLSNKSRREIFCLLLTPDFFETPKVVLNLFALSKLLITYGQNLYAFKVLNERASLLNFNELNSREFQFDYFDQINHGKHHATQLNFFDYINHSIHDAMDFKKDHMVKDLLDDYLSSSNFSPLSNLTSQATSKKLITISEDWKLNYKKFRTTFNTYRQDLYVRACKNDEKNPIDLSIFYLLTNTCFHSAAQLDEKLAAISIDIYDKKTSFEMLIKMYDTLNKAKHPSLINAIHHAAFQKLNDEKAELDSLKAQIMQGLPEKHIFQNLILKSFNSTAVIRNRVIERLCLLRSQVDLEIFDQTIGDDVRKAIGEEIAKLVLKGDRNDFALISHTFNTNLILAQHVADYLHISLEKDPSLNVVKITAYIYNIMNESYKFSNFNLIGDELAASNTHHAVNSLLDEKKPWDSAHTFIQTHSFDPTFFLKALLKAHTSKPYPNIILDILFRLINSNREHVHFSSDYYKLFTSYLITKIKDPTVPLIEIQPYLTRHSCINFPTVIEAILQEVSNNKINFARAKEICETIKEFERTSFWDLNAAIKAIGEQENFYLAEFLLENHYLAIDTSIKTAEIDEKLYPVTMLSMAASKGNILMVNYLLKKGALTNSTPNQISLALVCAIYYSHHDVMKTLLKNGAIFQDERNDHAAHLAETLNQTAPSLCSSRRNHVMQRRTQDFIRAYQSILNAESEENIISDFKKLTSTDRADLLSLFSPEKTLCLPRITHNLDKKVDLTPANLVQNVASNPTESKSSALPIAASFKTALENESRQSNNALQSTIPLKTLAATIDSKESIVTSSTLFFHTQDKLKVTDTDPIALCESILRVTLSPSGLANPDLVKPIQNLVRLQLAEIERRCPETAERIKKILISLEPKSADSLVITASRTP